MGGNTEGGWGEMKKVGNLLKIWVKKGFTDKIMQYSGKMPANKWHELKKLAPACYDNTRGCLGIYPSNCKVFNIKKKRVMFVLFLHSEYCYKT